MDLQVVGDGASFSSFQNLFEAQQEDGPSHRTMTLKGSTFSPARVPKLNEGLLLIRRQIEGDFRVLPFVGTLAFRGFPDDTLSRLKFLDIKFLAEPAREPKFDRVPNLGTAPPRVGRPPLRELLGVG